MVGGNDVFRSFVHEGRVSSFFLSSNKFNGFHIYNTLVSQIFIEILGYFCQLSQFPSSLRTAIYRTAVIGCLEARGWGTRDTGDVVDTGDISNSVQLYTAHAL